MGAPPPPQKKLRNPHLANLHEQICSWDNLWLAAQNAARGKRSSLPVASFEYRLADELLVLQQALRDKTYLPGAYHSFYVHEPKRRLISAAPFRDRVVHHALCNITVPYFEQRFIANSFANRVGKGTHAALDECQRLASKYRYVLQADVQQFFPAIDHALLRAELRKLLPRGAGDWAGGAGWLIDRILDSGLGVQNEQYDMRWFDGDDVFAANRPRGLPIGNLTSQWWGNCFLNSLDQFVLRELRCPAYLRYVDDIVLFSDSKAQLNAWRDALVARLARLRLTLHEAQCAARPVDVGIPILGFVLWPTHRRLKARKAIAFGRKFKASLADDAPARTDARLRGWLNHVRYGDTWGLRKSVLSRFNLLHD